MTHFKKILPMLLGLSCHGALAQTAATPATTPPPPVSIQVPAAAPTQVPSSTPASAQNTTPPIVQATVQTTVQTTEPAGFYYYCQSAKAYYPTVPACSEGWIAIPVGSPPPLRQQSDFSPWQQVETPESKAFIKANPNTVSLEFMGRAAAYSFDYDRAASEKVSLGLGISSWRESWRWSQYHSTVTVLPLYGTYYLSEKLSRGYLTAGLDFIHVTNDEGNNNNFMNNGVAVTAGAGYEARDKSGFLIRLAIYLIAGRSVEISPAVSFGFAF